MSKNFKFKQIYATLVLFAISIQMVSFSAFGQSYRNDQSEDLSIDRPIPSAADVGVSKIAPDLD